MGSHHDADGTASADTTVKDYSTTREPSISEKIQQARDEGHDADIPSDIGYVLDGAGEKRRQASIASKGRNSQTTDRANTHAAGDPEKQPTEVVDASGDENVVWWDGPDDPQNPYNWPSWRKVLTVVLVSALTFVTPLASCKLANKPLPKDAES
jgi:hypothetical protein